MLGNNAGLLLSISLALAAICAVFVSAGAVEDDSLLWRQQQSREDRMRFPPGRLERNREGQVGRSQRGRFGNGRQANPSRPRTGPSGRRPPRMRTTTPPSHISLVVPPEVRICF